MCLICNQEENEDCIILFVALAIVADVDNIYAESIGNHKLSDVKSYFPAIYHTHKELSKETNTPEQGRTPWSARMRYFYKFLRVLYSSCYYYYFAFMILPLTY